ncbi:hypothetical protein [Aeromicrobium sp. 179-A 4D2 NHS]|uniref:hypothetical protein n=1 Tax=Aeromicrobium sp. 179-A 4D2 NHS TaxID=3142375 RepID=UPI0039A2BB18
MTAVEMLAAEIHEANTALHDCYHGDEPGAVPQCVEVAARIVAQRDGRVDSDEMAARQSLAVFLYAKHRGQQYVGHRKQMPETFDELADHSQRIWLDEAAELVAAMCGETS